MSFRDLEVLTHFCSFHRRNLPPVSSNKLQMWWKRLSICATILPPNCVVQNFMGFSTKYLAGNFLHFVFHFFNGTFDLILIHSVLRVMSVDDDREIRIGQTLTLDKNRQQILRGLCGCTHSNAESIPVLQTAQRVQWGRCSRTKGTDLFIRFA